MSGPSFLDFARMANACYYAGDPLVPVYTRVFYGQLAPIWKAVPVPHSARASRSEAQSGNSRLESP